MKLTGALIRAAALSAAMITAPLAPALAASWIPGHYGVNGGWIPGHWADYIPPHDAPNGAYIPGHWVTAGGPLAGPGEGPPGPPPYGSHWVPGHYGPGGGWFPGHWAPN